MPFYGILLHLTAFYYIMRRVILFHCFLRTLQHLSWFYGFLSHFIWLSYPCPARTVYQHVHPPPAQRCWTAWTAEGASIIVYHPGGWQEYRDVRKAGRVVLHLGRAVQLPYCLTPWADGMQNQLVGSAWRVKYLFFLPNTILSLHWHLNRNIISNSHFAFIYIM